MRQFFLKSILSLSLSVGALSASLSGIELNEANPEAASSSAPSTNVIVAKDEKHPASIPVKFLCEILAEDGQEIGEYDDLGFWKNPSMAHLAKLEIASYLDLNSLYSLYRAGYINKWMWKVVKGKTGYIPSDLLKKLLCIALAIQTKDADVFLRDQASYFRQLSRAHLLGLFNSRDLKGYLSSGTETRQKYDSPPWGYLDSFYEGDRQNLRLIAPQWFTNHTTVHLNHNGLTVLSGLERLPGLQHIQVADNRLVALDLSHWRGLKEVRAENNQLESITGLGQQTNLCNLNIGRNKLTEIHGLEDLGNLTSLYAQSNRLSGVMDLSKLTQISRLNMANNRITEIKGLGGMTTLTALTVSRNPGFFVPQLNRLRQLAQLSLDQTGFTALECLNGLNQLFYLSLSGNGLTSLEALPVLPRLARLNLRGNNLQAFGQPTSLADLVELAISGNPAESLASLEHLSSLRDLDIRNMPQLTSLETLPLATRGRLENLKVHGNSFIKMPQIRDMGRLEKIELSQAQWDDRDNRQALNHLIEQALNRPIENDWLPQRGPSVFIPIFENGVQKDASCVRDRMASHAAAIPL